MANWNSTFVSWKGWPFATALLASAIFWLLAWYGDTLYSMVSIWQRSDTFAHGFFVFPIAAWLVWRRRRTIMEIGPRPSYMALPLLAFAGFGWFLADLAGAGVVQQYTIILMIALMVWGVLGSGVASSLAFPLFFLLLAVPVGEFLIPMLMQHTADFTVAALRMTGVPVYREGLFFVTPTGNWSVVEACSGLRYLIASLTLGLLYAYLMYRSVIRRAVFVVFSVLVPIVANWIRAYGIVMIGHLSGMEYATGVDHLLYGWVFFGLVMLLLFWIGSLWREDEQRPRQQTHPTPFSGEGQASLPAIMRATVLVAAIVAVWPAVAHVLENNVSRAVPLLQPPEFADNWKPVALPVTEWKPAFVNPTSRVNETYFKADSTVGLYIGYYRNQRQGAQLITSTNRLVFPGDRMWKVMREADRTVTYKYQNLPLIETRVEGPKDRLLVWRWYWVDGRYTANPYWGKLLQAKSRLLGNGDDGALVVVYTRMDQGYEAATDKLLKFVEAMLPSISRSLQHAHSVQP